MMRAVVAVALLGVSAGSAGAQGATGVTVFLERGGMVVDRGWAGGRDGIVVPKFGGTARAWNAVVACVREKYAAFDVDVVEKRPPGDTHITAVIGGRAEQFGFDPKHVAGVGVSNGEVIHGGVVHVFSKTIGERDVRQICNTAAHEVGHALGLDHSTQCGDLMGYPRKECGGGRDEWLVDADAPCGEYEGRECQHGGATQNSFRRLAMLVGLRGDAVEDDADGQRVDEPATRDDEWWPADTEDAGESFEEYPAPQTWSRDRERRRRMTVWRLVRDPDDGSYYWQRVR